MSPLTAATKRRLGASDLVVAPLGLGCMSLSGVYGPSDDKAAIDMIAHAVDELGVEVLDSSDMYGWGHNETLLGKAIASRRERITLVTKFGQVQRESGGNGVDGRPAYVMEACEASLRRLGVDTIDLYFQHRVDPQVPIEETVGAMARLIDQGKVRYIGLSEAAPDTIRRAHATHPLTAVQTEFSLLYREEAQATRRITTELEISFFAYSPLGRSLLTGAYQGRERLGDESPHKRHPRFADENLAKNVAFMTPLVQLATEKGCTVSQLALAWVLAQGPDVLPIPGTKRLARLEENIGAVDVMLSDAEVRRLGEAMPVGAAAGTRYPAGAMQAVQR